MPRKTIKPIILSYNQPEETTQIYNKLVVDGFTDIVVVDNGSDKYPPAKSANLLLPKNIRFTGQAKIALIYCMDYFPADYYWLITTSAILQDNINYAERIEQAFRDLDEIDVGVLSPSLVSDKALASQQYTPVNLEKNYSILFSLEPIADIISHKLLERCRKEKSAYFEKGLVRGWGVSYEILYEALLADLWCVIHYSMPIIWVLNAGYVKKVGGESLELYQTNAMREAETTLTKKYGYEWYKKMFYLYSEKVSKIKFNFSVSYEGPRTI